MKKIVIILGVLLLNNFQSIGQMCPIVAGSNLVTNGDFQGGCTSFTSEYNFNGTCDGGSVGPGNWTVTSNANARNSFFTNPTGANPPGEPLGTANQYLIIDADGTLGKDAYRSTVNVLNGTTYFFSAWISNINGTYENPPELKFSINGVQLGANLIASNTTHDWQQFYVTWTSATTGPVDIRLENLITTSNGNDLGIDAINFNTSCANIPNISTLGQSSVLPDTVYNCNIAFPLNLNPGLPGTYNLAWKKTAGSTLSSAATYNEPPTPADGTKLFLCYEYIPGCPRKDSVIFKTTPLAVELGPAMVMCAPVNIVLNSGVTNPPVTVQWLKNGTPVATTANYTATDIGNYTVNISRAGCGSASDVVSITNPVSTISGTGNYCAAGGTADFTVTGSSLIKWYTVPTGGVALNPGNTNPTITTTYAATNTTTPGCTSGLYAEDVSSYPGALMPAAPCAGSNTSNAADIMINVTQTMSLTSVDFYHNTGWGATGTFTFTLYGNNPTGCPYCGSCTPTGNKDGVGTSLYTENTPSYTVGGSNTVRTLNLTTPQTLTPGKYWLRIQANGTALGGFSGCDPARNISDTWTTPVNDNTGNSVMQGMKGMINGGSNVGGSGGLFNIKFQVGSSNACQRLFICAVDNCTAPVELIRFDVKKYSNGNSLVWETASEQNSSYFIVQRSIDGITFEDVRQVAAAGNSSTIISYSFLDQTYSKDASVVYYRLKQVDMDGAAHYSDIRSVQNDSFIQDINLYPIPVKRGQNVTLNYRSSARENITVDIIDNPGKVVSSGQFGVQEGSNSIELNSSSLASGLYHLMIRGTEVRTTKFVVE